MKIGLFLFHRDLRIIDNITLNALSDKCDKIIPTFIFTPEQVTNVNTYKSDASVQFMIESLDDLAHTIGRNKMLFMYGDTTITLERIIKENNVTVVGYNEDYTPYAIKRDAKLVDMCNKLGVEVISHNDFYLTRPGDVRTNAGKGDVYKKFTPFYNAVLKMKVAKPTSNNNIMFVKGRSEANITLEEAYTRFITPNAEVNVRGGRSEGIKIIEHLRKGTFDEYDKTRDKLALKTTELSAYLKFGCVSVREAYWAAKNNAPLIRQIYWRDFYAHVLFAYPDGVFASGNNIKWNKNKKWLDAWKEGRTGFPIVDAAMRQLNTTGYMHNRGRMIVASFLSKTLLIDWREGEKYFATKLVDYDVASNNLNWQWTVLDNYPYIRIFNPWTQSREHDPDATYIKKWVPELDNIEVNDIHNWRDKWREHKGIYTQPIVVFEEQRDKAMTVYGR